MSSAGGIKTDESQGLASLRDLSERCDHIMQGITVPDKIVSTKPPKRKKRVSDEMSQYINPVKYLSSSSYMDHLLRGNSHRYMRESSLDYGAYGSYGSYRDYDYYEPRYRPRSPSPPRVASSSKVTLEILRERERKKHSWEKSSKSEHKSKKKKEKEKDKNKSHEHKSMENISSSSSPKKEHRSSEDHDAKRSRLEGEFSESPSVPLSEKAKGKQKEVYNEKEEDTKQKTKTETGLTGSSTGTNTSGFIDGDYIIGDVDDVELHMAILASMKDAQPTKVSDDDDVLMKMIADVDKKEPPSLPELDDLEDISSDSDTSLPPIFEGEHAKIYADILEMDKKQKEKEKQKRKQKEKEKGKGKKISPAEMLEIARAEEREAYRQLKEVEKRAELQRLELERIMGKDWIYRNDYYY